MKIFRECEVLENCVYGLDAICCGFVSVKPKMDLKALAPIKVKEGETIHFDVPFDAEPPPTATWAVDDKVSFFSLH